MIDPEVEVGRPCGSKLEKRKTFIVQKSSIAGWLFCRIYELFMFDWYKTGAFLSFFSTGKTDSSSKNGGSPSRHDKSKDDTSDNHKDDPVQNNVTEEIKNWYRGDNICCQFPTGKVSWLVANGEEVKLWYTWPLVVNENRYFQAIHAGKWCYGLIR